MKLRKYSQGGRRRRGAQLITPLPATHGHPSPSTHSSHVPRQESHAPLLLGTCFLHGLLVHNKCVFIDAPQHGLCDIVGPKVAEEVSVLAVGILQGQLPDSLEEFVMEHEASGFQLIAGHFKVRTRVQKFASLNEIPTWENQTFKVRNPEREDELYKYHPVFSVRGHHSYDSFRTLEGRRPLR